MGTNVVSEMATLMRDHPYISCSLLIFLTPPFFPILKFFSPLLISTALFIVALVTMGPQFDQEEEPHSEPHHRIVADATTHRSTKIHFSPSDWIKSCKESGLAWVEQKVFRNDNWRASSLNDENVSILQEAFAHRAEATPHVMVKLVTRRIPAEDEDFLDRHASKDLGFERRASKDQSFDRRASRDRPYEFEEHSLDRAGSHERHASRDLPHDFEEHSLDRHASRGLPHDFEERSLDRHASRGLPHDFEEHSFDRHASRSLPHDSSLDRGGFHERHVSRDLPHDFFSPHPSHVSRRHDSDGGPLFEKVGPPPIEFDMPPLVTGPASVFRSFEDDSDDEYDHHHDEHMHLEVGERSLDAESQDELPVMNGTYDPPPFTVQEEDLPSSSDEDEERSYFKEWQQRPKEAESSQNHAPQEHADTPIAGHHREVHDIPELEDEVHVENDSAPVAAGEGSSWREFVAEAKSSDQLGAEPGDGHVDAAPGDHFTAKSADPGDQFDAESRDLHFEAKSGDHVEAASGDHLDAKSAGDAHFDAEPDHVTEAPRDHVSEELPITEPAAQVEDAVPVEPHHEHQVHHMVDRSMSLPVAGHPEMDVTPHEDQVAKSHEEGTHYPLSNAISLPSNRTLQPILIPPKTPEMEPLSPDTDLGYATSPERRRFSSAVQRYDSMTTISGDESELTIPIKQLSTREKLSNLEALCNSMDRSSATTPVAILRATTDEQVTHVTSKLKDYIEDSPSKKFQADAPQLQISPPSHKVALPSKSAILASALGRPSILSSRAAYSAATYSSTESSEDEQIDLDSDVEEGEEDSDSEVEIVEASGKSRFKAPPKPPGQTEIVEVGGMSWMQPPPKPPGEIVKSRT